MASLHYTAHYNWAWVVDDALNVVRTAQGLDNVTLCERFRDLPSSQRATVKGKPTYALFRFDVTKSNGDVETMVRTRSDIFGFLDPKDSLARICQLLCITQYMPDTLLIPWNSDSQSTLSLTSELGQAVRERLQHSPRLLKAPLGSGGFGLYFVYSLHDVQEIVTNHRRIAEEKDGFLQDLNNNFYGQDGQHVLSWSLQDIISGVRVSEAVGKTVPQQSGGSDGAGITTTTNTVAPEYTNSHLSPLPEPRRCQLRAYLVLIDDALYLYRNYEVRLPSWDIHLDNVLQTEHRMFREQDGLTSGSDGGSGCGDDVHQPNWTNALENGYCGTGHGRPYNECRNKGCTERYLLSEVPELAPSANAVTECMVGLFGALKPVFLSRQRASAIDKAADKLGNRAEMSNVFDTTAILAAVNAASDGGSGDGGSGGGTQYAPRLVEVAIAGVDLVLKQEKGIFTAYVVEINNNPAMPAAEGKHMSAQYRSHLVQFVSSVMSAALHGGPVGGSGDEDQVFLKI